jgi:hypothetical protein
METESFLISSASQEIHRLSWNQKFHEDCCLLGCSTEAARSSETLVNFYQTTRCYNPEDNNLHTHRRENLKSYTEVSWPRSLHLILSHINPVHILHRVSLHLENEYTPLEYFDVNRLRFKHLILWLGSSHNTFVVRWHSRRRTWGFQLVWKWMYKSLNYQCQA